MSRRLELEKQRAGLNDVHLEKLMTLAQVSHEDSLSLRDGTEETEEARSALEVEEKGKDGKEELTRPRP